MQAFLKTLSHKSGVAGRSTSAILELPMPEGGRASYRIWESPVMEPALAERFPGIKTYTGQGINDSTATIKIDFTELGFHAMVLSDVNEDIFIDPYRQQDSRNYVAYNKRDFKKKRPFSEIDVIEPSDRRPPTGNKPMAGICTGEELHSYRLAVACTGEYARAATGISNPTVGQALSAIVTSVNRVDGIYEREVAISLNLVSNNNLIVFVNPSTDPFSANDDGSALLAKRSSTLILGPPTMILAIPSAPGQEALLKSPLCVDLKKLEELQDHPTRWAILMTLTTLPMKWVTSLVPRTVLTLPPAHVAETVTAQPLLSRAAALLSWHIPEFAELPTTWQIIVLPISMLQAWRRSTRSLRLVEEQPAARSLSQET